MKLAWQTRGVRLANARYAHCERKTDLLKMLSEKRFSEGREKKNSLAVGKGTRIC